MIASTAASHFLILFSWCASVEPTVRFPGPISEAASPTGVFTVVWNAPEGLNGHAHRISLVERRTGRKYLLQEFSRWLSVSWAPDAEHLAVTEGAGSDRTEARVFVVGSEAPPIDVSARAVAMLTTSERSVFANAHHQYVEILGWIDSTTLSVRVWGYGDSGSLDKRVEVSISQ